MAILPELLLLASRRRAEDGRWRTIDGAGVNDGAEDDDDDDDAEVVVEGGVTELLVLAAVGRADAGVEAEAGVIAVDEDDGMFSLPEIGGLFKVDTDDEIEETDETGLEDGVCGALTAAH